METVQQLRRDALRIFQAGVAAADPCTAIKRCLLAKPEILASVGRHERAKIHVIAFGKAACAMAKAAVEIIHSPELDLMTHPHAPEAESHLEAKRNTLPPFSKGGCRAPDSGANCNMDFSNGRHSSLKHPELGLAIAVTNYENVTALEHVEVIGAGHPLPDAAGFNAAKHIAEAFSHVQPDDLVLVLVSGGGSALIPYPVDAISLEEKIATTRLLLSSGATINEINSVRKHLSKLKGGGLAKLVAPARLHALILSDVLGDDLSSIASGPTVGDSSTYSDAISVLKNYSAWDKAPESVRKHLELGEQGIIPETPKPSDPVFKNTRHSLIGSNTLSVQALHKAARDLGYETQLSDAPLCGYARDEAETLVLTAKSLPAAGLQKPVALLAGGETTVKLKGTGLGGRNQEMALAFAIFAEQQGLKGQWVFLSGGTDGRDGPTDAAGGIVDHTTYQRISTQGLDPMSYLDDNDSYHALKCSEDLLITGATGTNVADLQILLIYPENG